MNGKKLYRSESNRMLCGVCAGIAEYFDLDPTLIRLAWALVCFLGGSGIRRISSPRSSFRPRARAITI